MTAKKTKTLHECMIEIQDQLKAPKDKKNNFGGYMYRSAESILEAVKPLLKEKGLTINMSDCPKDIAGHAFIVATATISNGTESASADGCARDAIEKKGTDASQNTGTASSYSRKYALGGLFAIDDTKDADATNTHGKRAAKSHVDQKQVSGGIKETVDAMDIALDAEQVATTVINYFDGDKASARDFITDAGLPIPSECNEQELRGILDALKKESKKNGTY